MAKSEPLLSDSELPGLLRGTISQLTHLSSGTDNPAAHPVAAHNDVGYGFIRTPRGDVFFDASAIKNRRFDQLTRRMVVEFELDSASYLRTTRINVVDERPGAARE